MSHQAPAPSLFASPTEAALTGAATATAAVPVLGDVAGLAADAHMYATRPEERNWKNYLLTGLGALPFVPAVAAMGRATRNVPNPFGNQDGKLAFHGSQHRFDQFDGSKLGTGEGVQRFGPGHYVAEEPGVAGGYRQAGRNGFPVTYIGTKKDTDYGRGFESILTLDADEVPDGGLVGQAAKQKLLERLEHQAELVRKYGGRIDNRDPAWSMDNLIAVRREILDAPDEAVRIKQNKGYLYHVDVPDEIVPKMLDWDKPLREQPHVLEALDKIAPPRPIAGAEVRKTSSGEWFVVDQHGEWGSTPFKSREDALAQLQQGDAVRIAEPHERGEALWEKLLYTFDNDPMKARAALEQAGIPGIRYFDRGSRGTGQGTRNMVVFRDDHIKILKRENADDTVDEFAGSPHGR